MTRTLTVVSAGLRSPSTTRMLADRITDAALAALGRDGDGVEVRHVEVRDHAHAVVDALLTGFPTGDLAQAIEDVTAADALVVVTPTFQASYAGLFKSFMDLIGEGALRGVPVILAATGGTERHSLVVEHALRPLFAHLRAVPAATGVYAAMSDFGDGGAALDRRIRRAADDLADLVLGRGEEPTHVDSRARRVEDEFTDVTPFAELLARSGVTD